MTTPILAAQVCDNAPVFADILKLYAHTDAEIADVTYGKGAFWRDVNESLYNLHATDIMDGTDYRSLPYGDSSMDMVVLDPPYMGHNGGKDYAIARNYNVDVPKYNKDYIPNLYFGGINEAHRVLENGGKLVVKMQDEIQSGKQNMNHVTIINHCVENGFRVEDLFVVVQKRVPMMRHPYQKHARKNHSYFVVFTKLRQKLYKQ